MKTSVFRAIVIAVVSMASLLMSGCGFQLQGDHNYPFKRLYIAGGASQEMAAHMKRLIEAGSDTKVVTSVRDADAILSMTFARGQSALSFDINGVVQEYQLTTSVSYSLVAKNGSVLIPPSNLSVNRAMTYSDQYALAKQNESVLLNRDMDSDIADQLLRRLDVVQTLTPTEPDETAPGVSSRAPLPTPPL